MTRSTHRCLTIATVALFALATAAPLDAQSAPGPGAPPGAAPSGPGLPGGPGGPGDSDGNSQSGHFLAEMMRKILHDKNPPPLDPLPPPPTDVKDFNGTWIANQLSVLRLADDMYGSPIPLNAAGNAVRDRRIKAQFVDHMPYANASALCLPPGQFWQLNLIYPFQILQTRNALEFAFAEGHVVWGVKLDGPNRKPALQGAPAFMGHSHAHWDGDTLVIEVSDFKQPIWLDADGTPMSIQGKMTLRMRRIDQGNPEMEITATVDDPKYYTAPWSIIHTYLWRPDFALFYEFDCEAKAANPDFLSSYGYQPEPKDAQ